MFGFVESISVSEENIKHNVNAIMQMKKKEDLCNMIVKKMAIFCDMKIDDKWQCTNWVLL